MRCYFYLLGGDIFRLNILIILVLCSNLNSLGQVQAQIIGRIVTPTNQSLSYISVNMHHSADSVLMRGTLTDSMGRFIFEKLKTGKYSIAVTTFDTSPLYIATINVADSSKTYDVGSLIISERIRQLDEIKITARKTLIERKIDHIVAHIEGSALAKGNNLFQVLSKLPFLKASYSGSLTMNNSEVLLLIDGKREGQGSIQAMNKLRTMKSENIEKIEIYTNPPAKFEAQGAGVVNVILRKEKMYSDIYCNIAGRLYPYTNVMGLSYNSYSIGTSYFFKTGKWSNNIIFDLSNYNDGFEVGRLLSSYSKITRTADYTSESGFLSRSISFDTNYKLSEKDDIQAQISYNRNPTGFSTTVQYNTFGIDTNPNISVMKDSFDNTNANVATQYLIGYTHKIKGSKEKKWTTDVVWGKSQDIDSFEFPSQKIIQTQQYNGHFWSIKTDVQTKVEEGYLSLGIKYTSIQNNNFFNAANIFFYQEDIKAAYLNFRKSYTNISYQVGLRAENTHSQGESSDTSLGVLYKTYISFFPSLFLQYTISENTQISFSVNRRIIRPPYSSFNPFTQVSWNDAYQTTRGNPQLNPQFVNKIELGYTWKDFNFTSAYTLNRDVRSYIFQPIENSLLLPKQLINFNTYYWFNTFFYSFNITPYWQSSSSLTFSNSTYLSNATEQKWAASLSSNNTIQLSKSCFLDVNLSYQTSQKIQYMNTNTLYYMDIGGRIELLKEKLNVGINVEDVFGSNRVTILSKNGMSLSENKLLSNNRMIRLSLSYKIPSGTKFQLRKRRSNDFGEIRGK